MQAGEWRTAEAPAKLNLALHVTGQRADGYHELDSVVTFARIGDGVSVLTGGGPPALTVDGPFANAIPTGPDNIVVKAASAVGGIAGVRLTKRLPVAAGIGGGSADAAAVLRLAPAPPPPADLARLALALGADVPVCFGGTCARMRGIGEALAPLRLPHTPVVLLNPGVPVSTAAVFQALPSKCNAPVGAVPALQSVAELAEWLTTLRNDLEAPARALAPAVDEALAAMAEVRGCLLARMSGSGATVFGLFGTDAEAQAAAETLRRAAPDHWWIEPSVVGGDPADRPLSATARPAA